MRWTQPRVLAELFESEIKQKWLQFTLIVINYFRIITYYSEIISIFEQNIEIKYNFVYTTITDYTGII